jgi:hypothetical protein
VANVSLSAAGAARGDACRTTGSDGGTVHSTGFAEVDVKRRPSRDDLASVLAPAVVLTGSPIVGCVALFADRSQRTV